MNEKLLKICEEKAKGVYETFDASHDWQHIERVRNNARLLLENEPADPFITELAVLLHDIGDAKYRQEGEDPLGAILKELALPGEQELHVREAILSVSFSGGNEKEAKSPEAAVLRDADRLDAIGAVGIARAFTYGGAKGRKLYDRDEKPRAEMTEAEYRQKQTATVTHFHEKLLLLKDRMLTPAGKRLAEDRHRFMVCFLEQLQNELDGKR